MAEQELRELLTEFQTLPQSEHHSFLSTIVNNFSYSNTIFAALVQFEDRPKPPDLLEQLCTLLFTIYRGEDLKFRQFSLQFIPALCYIYLQSCGIERGQGLSSLETLLVALHNLELGEGQPSRPAFKIPSLNVSSIYHESSCIAENRIFAVPDTHEREKERGGSVRRPPPQQVSSINGQNRGRVMDFLFGVYSSLLGEYCRPSLELSCRTSTRMVTRGFHSSGGRKSHRRNTSFGSDSGVRSPRHCQSRVLLPSSVYLELIQLGYFAIFNGYPGVGVQLVKDIEFRGRHDSLANVLLVSRAVLQLATRASGSIQEPHMATPSQLTKNMITNASFRTKKLEADIARVETEEEERMGVISEEQEQEDKAGLEKVAGTDDKVNIADKIKAKMENVRENVRMPDGMRIRKKERGEGGEAGGERKERSSEKKERRREKLRSESRGVREEPELEEGLRLASLAPSDMGALHSPEATTTFLQQ